MKEASILYAIEVFRALTEEFSELAVATGLPQPRALIRQRWDGVERGWACTEIGLTSHDEEWVFWGKFAVEGKQHVVVFDPETLDSIEFETYGKVVQSES